MGLLIALATVAPVLGVAAVMDWRSRRRRRQVRRPTGSTGPRRDVELGLDLRDLGDS